MHTVFTEHLATLKNVMVVAHERINERYKELIKSEFEETYKELRQDISDVEHELTDATNKMNEFTSTIGKALEDGILTKAEIVNINRLKE
jgi:paraquat-inducible protein B